MYSYDWSTANILGLIQGIILLVSGYFGAVALKKLSRQKHKKSEIMRIKRVVFSWLTTGIFTLAFAFLAQTILSISGWYIFPSVADVFFVLAYSSLALGFNYFWYKTAKMHKLHIKEPFFVLGVFCSVFIWLYYMFTTIILPGSSGARIEIAALNYFYPIIVSLLFLLTLVVHPRLKAGVIRTPIWYLSSGVFVYFIAEMIREYWYWRPVTVLQNLFVVLFIFSSLYFLLGFYAAQKKYR